MKDLGSEKQDVSIPSRTLDISSCYKMAAWSLVEGLTLCRALWQGLTVSHTSGQAYGVGTKTISVLQLSVGRD